MLEELRKMIDTEGIVLVLEHNYDYDSDENREYMCTSFYLKDIRTGERVEIGRRDIELEAANC